LEREFLSPVNKAVGGKVPLAGMTAAAIESWRDRAIAVLSIDVSETVAQLLSEASARAQLLADNSRDVFEPESRGSRDSLDELRIRLERTLSNY
jgi:hypothetical protein